jgi:3-oxoacyl-[acyl-carrier protein] reductase
MNQLSGKVLVVTGASSGIGQAIATAAAHAGADMVLTYKTNKVGAEATRAAVSAAGCNATVVPLDLDLPETLTAVSESALRTFGRIDGWINNAGADVLTGATSAMPQLDRLDRLLSVDLRGTMLASWHAAAIMQTQSNGGVIINIGWDHALTGMPGVNPQLFAAVKGGITAFSKALARSVAPLVRVNVIAPGWIETAFGAGLDSDRYEEIRKSVPLSRWGTPDDVAQATVFLVSPAAAYLTGHTLVVGGGVVMQ